MLAYAGGDCRIEIPTAPTKNPKSETMISTPDDAELLKDLRGLGKPQLFDENDTDQRRTNATDRILLNYRMLILPPQSRSVHMKERSCTFLRTMKR